MIRVAIVAAIVAGIVAAGSAAPLGSASRHRRPVIYLRLHRDRLYRGGPCVVIRRREIVCPLPAPRRRKR